MSIIKKAMFVLSLALAALLSPSEAEAQSGPIYPYSYQTVWTPLQWNAIFAAKQDYLNAAPCIVSGCVMSGKIYLNPSTNAYGAGLNFFGGPNGGTPGVQPASIQPGDIWMTSVGIYYSINGSTVIGPLNSQPTLAFPNVVATGATSGGVLCANSTTNVTMSSLLASQSVVVGGGSGNCPVTITTPGAIYNALQLSPNVVNGFLTNTAGSGSPLHVVTCTIPNTAAAATNWCAWKAGNTGLLQPFFDDIVVTLYGTCSTTYPVVQVYDVTNSTGVGSTTAANSTVVTSINAAIGGSTATDQYAFRVTTTSSGCAATLATEFMTVSATYRGN